MWNSNGGGATKHLFFPKCFVEVMSFDLSGSPEVDGGETLTKVVLSKCAAFHILMVWRTPSFRWHYECLNVVGAISV